MNKHYLSYIKYGKELAERFNIDWNIQTTLDGAVDKNQRWNLTTITKSTPPPTHWLSDLGEYANIIKLFEKDNPLRKKRELSSGWKDLIKAVTLDFALIKKIKTGTLISSVIPPLKVIATCSQVEPWELKIDHLFYSIEMAQQSQTSGALADWVIGVTKNILDRNHISNFGPLYPLLSSIKRKNNRNKKSSIIKTQEQLLIDLENRKKAEKLPDKQAFWELMRIVFTEKPLSFVDALRFAQVKLMLICGLRIGEATLLPADWKRKRTYITKDGESPSLSGGYSQALMLRHFAEKQKYRGHSGSSLIESTQYIPQIFENILEETLDNVLKITKPLRDTLEKQIKQNRILPWFDLNSFISAKELYPYLSGNPIFLETFEKDISLYRSQYFESFDVSVLNHVVKLQMLATTDRASFNFYMFYNRLCKKVTTYSASHMMWSKHENKDWNNVYFSIREIEDYLKLNKKTKLSDTEPFHLNNILLQPYELLFLIPKRALSEQRQDSIFDISRSYGIGRFDASTMTAVLTGSGNTTPSLFKLYGQTEQDKLLSLSPHSLRHLQNGELFRLGIADTIISKRFNRKSIAMSYEYDHRSLGEQLEEVELPPDIESQLGDKTATVARLIKSKRASGPIVEKFNKIQQEQGEMAAFEFLKVEADGFHSTPYGHCINSFTVDPCPKNLECFAGCNYLSATNLPEQRRSLETLLVKFEDALRIVQNKSITTIGRNNQIEHASQRIQGIKKLLNTPNGQQVFPEGKDYSIKNQLNGSILDD